MATAKPVKKIVLNFAAPPSNSKSFVKQVFIAWTGNKNEIVKLCVTLCTLKTGELVFLLVDLKPLQTVVNLPLQLDTTPGTVRMNVYGLARKEPAVDKCYFIAGSRIKKLEQPFTEKLGGVCQIQLSNNHSKNASCMELKEKTKGFEVSIQQQPPAWYYISGLPTLGSSKPSQYFIVLQRHEAFEEMVMLRHSSQSTMIIPTELSSLTDFTVKVYQLNGVFQTDSFAVYTVKMASDSKKTSFRTYLCSSELQELYKRAMSLTPKNTRRKAHDEIYYFYRNKPPEYFAHIFSKRQGLMEKYRKDYNGDQGSSINGNLDGLFFGTSLDPKTKQPPTFSFYGRRRLHIPATVIFHDNTNLYFADFYCHNEWHYVTLVLTEYGSMSDDFCRNRLLSLDPFDNPFLFKRAKMLPLSQHTVHVATKLHVEVFYTESVSITYLQTTYPNDVFFADVAIRGAGKTKVMGIPKNARCKICNLK